MWPSRSAGNAGSSGTYAAPAFHTPSRAACSSAPRPSSSPTVDSAPTPAARNRCAIRLARRSSSPYDNGTPSTTTAGASGVRAAQCSNRSGADQAGVRCGPVAHSPVSGRCSASGSAVARGSPSGPAAICSSTARYRAASRSPAARLTACESRSRIRPESLAVTVNGNSSWLKPMALPTVGSGPGGVRGVEVLVAEVDLDQPGAVGEFVLDRRHREVPVRPELQLLGEDPTHLLVPGGRGGPGRERQGVQVGAVDPVGARRLRAAVRDQPGEEALFRGEPAQHVQVCGEQDTLDGYAGRCGQSAQPLGDWCSGIRIW